MISGDGDAASSTDEGVPTADEVPVNGEFDRQPDSHTPARTRHAQIVRRGARWVRDRCLMYRNLSSPLASATPLPPA